MVDRAAGPQASSASASWRPRWTKPRGVAAGRAVLERQLDLLDVEPGADGVDRHPHLAAEARREREEAARAAGESARWPESGSRASKPERARISARAGPLRDPEAAALPLGEARRSRGRRRRGERAQVAREVGVARAAARPGGAARSASVSAWPLPRRGSRRTRAPAASARVGRRVARAVVGDDHLAPRETPPAAPRPSRRSALLVARGDEDRQRLSHPRGGSAAASGRRRRVAVA